MKKPRKEDSFLKQPYYEGGDVALKKFIGENLKYPASALDHKIEGSVPITLDINFQGEVSEVKTISSLGHGCEEEAIRLGKLLKFKVPKLPRNVKVVFHKKLTIHFHLPKQKEVEVQPISYQIQYTSTPVPLKQAEKQKEVIHYTITISS